MTTLALILSLYFFGNNQRYKLNSSPTGIVKLKLAQTIINPDFYSRVRASINANGNIVCYNEGNTKIYVYNQKGKLLSLFGEAGEGPGELSRMMFSVKHLCAGNKIFIHRTNRMMVFNLSGQLLYEYPVYISSANLYKYQNNIILETDKNLGTKMYKLVLDQEGKRININKNMLLLSSKERVLKIESEKISPRVKGTDLGLIRYNTGSYQLEFLDQNQKLIKEYRRDFTRILRKTDIKKYIPNMNIDPHYPDIKSVLGNMNEFLFVQTTTESARSFQMDVINTKKNTLHANYQIHGDIVQYARIEQGKLLLTLKNDEDGIYVEIYNVKIN